jgi:hypothetical protein
MLTAGDSWIGQEVEKRQDKRLLSHAPVIFSIFGSKFHREYASMTFNHSDGGLCIETAQAIHPGTTLYIRRGKINTDEPCDTCWQRVRTSSLGEVKWCREIADKYGTYFCIGVRYY